MGCGFRVQGLGFGILGLGLVEFRGLRHWKFSRRFRSSGLEGSGVWLQAFKDLKEPRVPVEFGRLGINTIWQFWGASEALSRETPKA